MISWNFYRKKVPFQEILQGLTHIFRSECNWEGGMVRLLNEIAHKTYLGTDR